MPHSIFGWSYPPGCSGPPEYPDPSPESEQVWGMLEEAGVEDAVIKAVCKIVDDLADELARAKESCPTCERLAAEAEAEANKAAEEYWASQELPQSTECPHGNKDGECNACFIAGDLAYDAARERRYSR